MSGRKEASDNKNVGLGPEKADENLRIRDETGKAMAWYSPKAAPFRLAGFAWFAQDAIYRRLPLAPAYPLPTDVDSLANCSAGGQIQFQTDSTRLYVRVELQGPSSMWNMAATAQCSFDCYIGQPTAQRYCVTTSFDRDATSYEAMLFEDLSRQTRNITLNFPLYQGVTEVLVGLDPDADILPPPPYAREGRCVVYGTSITQGGCASRPGMLPTNTLSRRLNVEFINLGFSGSGKGEPEVAKTISEIENPICYVLDYEANSQGIETFRNTLPEFIRILRQAHPDVPIIVMPCHKRPRECFSQEALAGAQEYREFQRTTVEELRCKGDEKIVFLDASEFLGEDFDECTVDGCHPNDLGFLRIANGMEPLLREVLIKT